MTPVPTASVVGPNGHTGLTTCAELNTAVAARVGTHRVSFEPNLSGKPDPSGMQLRVDGTLTTPGPQGLGLGPGGRVVKSAVGGGIEISFPDGTLLVVTPNFWTSQGTWYLNVNAYHAPAQNGTMGALAPGSWLPALPDGTSMGPRPASLHDRYVALYDKFGAAWRVSARAASSTTLRARPRRRSRPRAGPWRIRRTSSPTPPRCSRFRPPPRRSSAERS